MNKDEIEDGKVFFKFLLDEYHAIDWTLYDPNNSKELREMIEDAKTEAAMDYIFDKIQRKFRSIGLSANDYSKKFKSTLRN